MPVEVTKSQLNKIGERLRKGTATEDDIRKLDEYRISFLPAYQRVLRDLQGMGLEPGGRPQKTTPSIVAKLEREKTRLSRMQDIAGCRVQVPNLIEQNRVAADIEAKYHHSEVQDRRAKPSHGYRAVHLVAEIDGKQIEIQIRTDLQHGWAVMTEKLADIMDPKLKYGAGPANAQEILLKLADAIAILETEEEGLIQVRQVVLEGTSDKFEAFLQGQQRPDGAFLLHDIRAKGGLSNWLEQMEANIRERKRFLTESWAEFERLF